MKKAKFKEAISAIATVLIFTFGIQVVYANDLLQQNKDAKKNIAKEVERMEREGYIVPDGKPSLKKQIEDLWMQQSEVDDENNPVCYTIVQKAMGESFPMASTKAHELAKEQLVDQIQTRILKMVDDKVAKNEYQQEQAFEIVDLINANKYMIMATLGQTMPVFQAYRKLPEKKVEVILSFACNNRVMINAAIRGIRDNIGDRSSELITALDKLIKR